MTKSKHTNQNEFKKLPIPAQYYKGNFVLLRTNGILKKGIISSKPHQIMLYFVFDVKLKDEIIKNVSYNEVIVIPKEVWDMTQPYICDVCHEWYDYDCDNKTPSICRKCFNKFEKADKEKCIHVEIEVPANLVNRIQWNCTHYIICKECGKFLQIIDSSD
jgi:hypothetical protein